MPKLHFDRIDNNILGALQKNARISNKELAAQVGLAPSSCLERVRRLQRDGVLTGYRANVNPKALGVGLQAFVAVRMARHSRDLVETFRAHLLTLPEVVSVYHMGGENDFLVHVAVRDANHLRDLALDAFTTRAEVSRMETAVVYEHVQPAVWPNYALDAE
jgi:DNA-binding Lrp family transcriptional regulator